ncbi:MAG: UDP-3-O-(3-hydroxymyristoyl)glucosamine N-acyltransferase [Verrucomicrobiota bacterium]
MELTVEDIAVLTGGTVVRGDGGLRLSGLASLGEAGVTDLSFLGNEKYVGDFVKTAAGAVLVTAGVPEPEGEVALIEVANPSLAFSQVLEHSLPKRMFEVGVHPQASVDPSARVEGVMVRAGAVVEAGVEIGEGTEVGPGVVIERGVTIGGGCLLHGNAVIREGCVLGERVVLQPGAVIGSDGYGYELVEGKHRPIPQAGIVVLEDEVEIGANTTIDRARFGKTVIGAGTKIDNLVQIAHNVVTGEHCLIVSQSGVAGSSSLGNYVTLAAQTGIAGHIHIDDQVILAARSATMRSLEGPGTYFGAPALPIQEEKKRLILSLKIGEMRAELKELKKRLTELEKG